MEVSRQTYGRILSEARRVIAEAIVTGKILRVEGGNYEFRCPHKRRQRRKCCQHVNENNDQDSVHSEMHYAHDSIDVKTDIQD
jgi:hypothetical protein